MKGDEAHDPSVCLTFVMVEHDYYLIDVYRERAEYPDFKRAMVNLARRFRSRSVLIEDAGAGQTPAVATKSKHSVSL